MKKNSVLIIIAFLALNLMSIQEHGVAAARISIDQPWARATLVSPASVSTSAVFMTLHNNQDQDDVLESVSTDVCETVELHTHIKEGDVMRMRPLKEGIFIPAHQAVTLEPGGLHIMLIGLKQAFQDAEDIPLTLNFQKAGSIKLFVPIKMFKNEKVKRSSKNQKIISSKNSDHTPCNCDKHLKP